MKNYNLQFEEIVGKSKALKNAQEKVLKVAKSNSSILIKGESGTGKELFAKAIHKESLRSDENFVSINCAAIPGDLLESELFGYEAGAFTGAKKEGKPGRFIKSGGKWNFEEGMFNTNLSYDLRLQDCLSKVSTYYK